MLPKDQKGIALLVVLLFIFSIAVTAVLGYKFGKGTDNTKQAKTTPTPSASARVVITNKTPESVKVNLEDNALYLGEDEGDDAIFYTNERIRTGYQSNNLTVGVLSTTNTDKGPYDFKKLANPKKIIAVGGEVSHVMNFKKSGDSQFIFISLITRTPSSLATSENYRNIIYKVNVEKLQSEKIWENEIGKDKYGEAKGAAKIENLSSNNLFLLLDIFGCHLCEATSSQGKLVLNIESKKEKFLEDIGNVNFQQNEGKFTFQKLVSQEESCDGGFFCFNGKTTVEKPSGETLSENLP